VKAFLDTSVLVAAFYGAHEHHKPSFELFVNQERRSACTAAHCLAEVYSTVTGMPGKARVSGSEALLFLGNVRERLMIVTLDPDEYFKALEGASDVAVVGGGIYDAIIGHCAMKFKADSLYTWNVKHFKRLGPDIARRVKTPAAFF
jgi:predicted nucleic acid-binding protein